ncbi:MAG: DUF1428 domain-containing protein [Hyphomonadaceae bacterium]|jgi:uncharacterized protein YbaA (DUF1428 family)|nr:DUF1428 domain-containing protein [Hyphomonadaceae bacterium]
MPYVDGYVLAVPKANREAYRALAEMSAAVFRDHGAVRVVEAWADDVPHGKLTDLYMAVKATEDEDVVFSWIEWPSKEARDAGNAAVMTDPRMGEPPSPDVFDGKRMIFGGFTPIVDV